MSSPISFRLKDYPLHELGHLIFPTAGSRAIAPGMALLAQ